jgi:hypothetical protein
MPVPYTFAGATGAIPLSELDANFVAAGNATTVTNGVYTTGSYANPAWITSLAGAKIIGTVADATTASTVTNGVVTTGSYANPAWITSLAGAKITGTVANATNATTATTATTATSVPYSGLTGVVPTWNQNTTGNAATATALQTARTIGGVSFNGTANINLPGVNTEGNQNTTGTSANVTGTVAVSNGGTGQTTFTNGQLLIGNTTGGTLAKATLTAGTGVSITNGAGSISIAATNNGTVTSVGGTGTVNGLTLTGTVTSSGNLTLGGTLAISATQITSGTLAVARGGTGATTSTGSGAVVLATSPTLVTPALGTPSSGNLANCTFPTLNQNTTGNAATATTASTANALNTGNSYTALGYTSTSNVFPVSPVGNPTGGAIAATYASVVAQTSTIKGTVNREWAGVFGLTNTQGYGAANNNGDKVTIYGGIVASGANAGDSWSLNTVLTVESDAPSDLKGHGYECDVNNLQGHRDSYGAGSIYGVSSTGAGPYRCTAAFLVSGVSTNWQRGLAISSVNDNSIEDTSDSVTSYMIFGSHTTGMDLSSSVCTTGIKLGTNTITGTGGSVIGTSDQRAKNTIQDSNLGLDFICALRPVSYKYNEGKSYIPKGGTYEDVVQLPGTRTHYGLIAQEVKQALPPGLDFGGWVLHDAADSDSTQGLRYDEFIAPLVKAVQELKAETVRLQDEIKVLQG